MIKKVFLSADCNIISGKKVFCITDRTIVSVHVSSKRCHFKQLVLYNPANIYLFKVDNRNARKRCEICSNVTIKTPEGRH